MGGWAKVLEGVGGKTRDLTAGDMLFHCGEEARALFLLERGRVRLTGGDGVAHEVKAGEGFAESALFAPTYAWDAEAVAASRVRMLSKARVLLHLRAHPDLNLAFSAALAQRLDSLRVLNDILRLKSARERVPAWLAHRGAASGPITLDMSLTAAAAEIGLTHEAFYRTLATLVREGRLERPERRTFYLRPIPAARPDS